MKIAQIAPLAERCPPSTYGGTERIVSYLTEELVQQGHDVTLFASGDSVTRAELVPCCNLALRLDTRVCDPLPYHLMMVNRVMTRAEEFDVLHFHIDMLHYPLLRRMPIRSVTTLHGRLDLPDLQPFYASFPDFALVSVSAAQRLPMPPVNWAGTVHHGLPPQLLTCCANPRGDYLAFLGRIAPEKRPDRAIEIARRAGMQLKIAAKIDRVDRCYWESTIGPLVAANPHVEYIGEIGEREKSAFLGNARALLFPVDWPEPFGLVMIEAMACGTPVVAFSAGSVSEIIDPGVSGYVVHGIDEAVAAVHRASALPRTGVRAAFEARFTVARMASDYVQIYGSLDKSGAADTPAGQSDELEVLA
ncbi:MULTISPECIES: glycosyltransferase family 4 protein [unclassified Cupriavidus]|uniref:glycosyltransferase family 4 protein n=1 Tax=unclassified Cupriavidus TaxID=2640874 RepID=UPI001AE70565|nr:MULTISPECIES: glycosyltransferase family 4 protein [unclassified Cupriavidus]MBP0632718.1 glycosyltransferase family 4 protein [Cupriavidus sp. AcVe19-1a]MBP0639184.1 glycosyltransferase family 4 protein [Cupriavidus sp. AcVe19-6a]